MTVLSTRVRGAMLVAAPVLLLAACGGGASQESSNSAAVDSSGSGALTDEQTSARTAYDRESVVSGEGPVPLPNSNAAKASPSLPAIGREVIAVADVTIRVDDVEATLPDLMRAATSVGGYVSGEETKSDPDNPSKSESTVVLRVPTASLERVLKDVGDLGELLRSHQEVQDVTQQVVDVDSRVKSAKASVARIRFLLDQATTLGQVVRIESQLARREADLESLVAQQRALADQTAMATLTVNALGPEAASTAPAQEDETGFVAGLSRGWTAFVDVLVVGLTAVGLLIPFALAGALVLVPLWFFWRRRQERIRAADSAQPSTA